MRLSLGSGVKLKKAFFVQKLTKTKIVPPNSSKDFIVIIGIATLPDDPIFSIPRLTKFANHARTL